MLKSVLWVLCLSAVTVSATNWRPSDRLLNAVWTVESARGAFTWGDNGRSLGDYQLSEAAWTDVNAWRKNRNLRTYEYQKAVWDRRISRVYAADYLSILHGELRRRLSRAPTIPEIYAAYNMGLSSFAECNFDLANVNRVTAKKCQVVLAMATGR
jgi:hypothetical protein